MQSKIPPKIREELSEDPFMQTCILFFDKNADDCEGRVEWQHAWTYGGKRVNELYTILPMCSKHHKEQAKYRKQQEEVIRHRILYFNVPADFILKYPKQTLFK